MIGSSAMVQVDEAHLRVPATSANLGPGFDTLGLAVDLELDIRARRSDSDSFRYSGDGSLPGTPDNLLHEGFRAACVAAGEPVFPVTFEVSNPIPLARGLGSSSAALVGGAAAADALLGGPLGKDGVFDVTSAIEGHPDNVGPAIYGGFTVSATDGRGRYTTRSLPVPPSWQLLFAVPAFELRTEEARRLVPEEFTRADVIRTSSRAAMWALAVARDEPELLRTASLDVLHQPYRAPLLPGFGRCLEEVFAAGGYAAFLSGAGPTVGAVAGSDAVAGVKGALATYAGEGGRVLQLVASNGYRTLGVNEPVNARP